MDARTESRVIPLAVDLDGTLISTDLLWETVFALVKSQPVCLFLIPFWLMSGGKVRLKAEVARRVTIEADVLPYRSDVVAWLREQRAAGRRLILATASPKPFADAVARHLGLFDEVLATSDTENLRSAAKRDALVRQYGDGGFDYVGNSADDVALFDAARESVVVAPDRAARQWHETHGGMLFDGERPSLKTILKMLRVHQWLKNSLIAVPLILAHEVDQSSLIVSTVLAILAFSFTASSIYILNDLFDLPADRRHAKKKRRPFAAGTVSIPVGLMSIAMLLAGAFAICLALPPLFAVVLVVYLFATTFYSIAMKRMLLIDVFMLAGLYTMRLAAGAAATGIAASFWLLAFSGFFFLSLALVKRYVELATTTTAVGEKLAGRGYRPEDLPIAMQAGMSSAFAAALVLALYVDSDAVTQLYAMPWMIWPLSPIVLYINLRLWVLAQRGEMDDDPVVFIIKDWRSQIVIALSALLVIVAASF